MNFWNPGAPLSRMRRPGPHPMAQPYGMAQTGGNMQPLPMDVGTGGGYPANPMSVGTGGYDPASQMPGMSTGGSLPPQLMPIQTGGGDPAMQVPGVQTGGNDPAYAHMGAGTGGGLPPQANGYGYGLARMGMSRPDNGTFAQTNNRLAGRMLVR